ncbi:Alpha/Beta hydrolase protein [Absidia repens]|uniref:Alpha/Beta hydrolase protein n=1 Tax=Absidia repens TaxID=90262 RepID=A0A1X2I517_9FUNG|nr:Alpha/Beta hydrolase protein [Absidia repens]
MSVASFRHWLVFILLKCAFAAVRTCYSRFFIYCVSFLIDNFDTSWLLPDASHGLWIGSMISSDKKEALVDRLVASDIIIVWVPGGGFRFDLGGLYIPTFVHWIKKLATKDIKCTMLLATNCHFHQHPFPAAMKDISAIHRWLVEDMGIPCNKLIWGADDTGAAIVLDTLYHKIEAENRPAGLLLSSPYIGLDAGGKSWQDNNRLDIITIGAVNRMESIYGSQVDNDDDGGDDDNDNDGLPFAPGTTTSVREVPLGYLGKSAELAKYLPSNILVSVGGNEVLLDDAVWLVARIRESGVSDISLLQCPGQIHLGTLLGPAVVKDRLEWDRSLDNWVDFIISVLKR